MFEPYRWSNLVDDTPNESVVSMENEGNPLLISQSHLHGDSWQYIRWYAVCICRICRCTIFFITFPCFSFSLETIVKLVFHEQHIVSTRHLSRQWSLCFCQCMGRFPLPISFSAQASLSDKFLLVFGKSCAVQKAFLLKMIFRIPVSQLAIFVPSLLYKTVQRRLFYFIYLFYFIPRSSSEENSCLTEQHNIEKTSLKFWKFLRVIVWKFAELLIFRMSMEIILTPSISFSVYGLRFNCVKTN